MLLAIVRITMLLLVIGSGVVAQTSVFNYQGRLTDGASPANGNFQMQFKLFDAVSGGAQQGSTLNDVPVTVANGVFSVKLDFGSAVFAGANRWIEVAVRRNAGESYVLLTPREQITSSPYSLRTVSAALSDDSQKLGGFAAADYVRSSTVSGTFIQNTTVPQSANFNITGSGFVGGNLGVGTTSPTSRLSVFSNFYGVSHTDGSVRLSTFLNSAGGWFGTTTNHPLHFYTNDSNPQMTITQGGGVGIGTTAPLPGYYLDVIGPVRSFGNTTHFVAQTTGGTNSWARFYMRSNNRSWFMGTSQAFNGDQLYIADETAGQTRMVISTLGNVGIGTTNPTTKLDVVGTTKTGVLQITGGSDLAENFEILDAQTIKPGMLVAIDPNSAEKLAISRGAYNRNVVGIISGANGLAAGMLLPDPKNTEGSLPVALSGRAWVYADATKNPIRPGDMLTTADLPGYAMRATNSKRAVGAVIGKAMTELRSGTGLVLVFVTLQ